MELIGRQAEMRILENGVKRNEHFLNQIQSEIKADVLFD